MRRSEGRTMMDLGAREPETGETGGEETSPHFPLVTYPPLRPLPSLSLFKSESNMRHETCFTEQISGTSFCLQAGHQRERGEEEGEEEGVGKVEIA